MANGNSQRTRRTKVRTLFLSDIHLGFKRARTRELNEFLQGVDAECIVLVGDIVDALAMARRFFWSTTDLRSGLASTGTPWECFLCWKNLNG